MFTLRRLLPALFALGLVAACADGSSGKVTGTTDAGATDASTAGGDGSVAADTTGGTDAGADTAGLDTVAPPDVAEDTAPVDDAVGADVEDAASDAGTPADGGTAVDSGRTADATVDADRKSTRLNSRP